MAAFNTTQLAGMATAPFQLPTAELGYGGKEYCYVTSITYAAQANGSTINGPIIPKSRLVKSVELMTSVSTGSATLAAGNAGTAAKYIAAAAITTAGVSTEGNLAIADPPVPLAADEQTIITVGGAALPGAGVLWIITHTVGL